MQGVREKDTWNEACSCSSKGINDGTVYHDHVVVLFTTMQDGTYFPWHRKLIEKKSHWKNFTFQLLNWIAAQEPFIGPGFKDYWTVESSFKMVLLESSFLWHYKVLNDWRKAPVWYWDAAKCLNSFLDYAFPRLMQQITISKRFHNEWSKQNDPRGHRI